MAFVSAWLAVTRAPASLAAPASCTRPSPPVSRTRTCRRACAWNIVMSSRGIINRKMQDEKTIKRGTSAAKKTAVGPRAPLRVGLVGGNANNGLNGGPRYLNANNAPGNANTNVSSRLNLAHLLSQPGCPAPWQNITVTNSLSSYSWRNGYNCQAHAAQG